MIYFIDSQAVTLASANSTKSAMGTAKFVNGFYNPSTSNCIAQILRAKVATTSGTPAGPLFYNYLNFGTSTTLGSAAAVVITSAATGTIQASVLGQGGSQMFPQVNVTLTATGSITTNLIQHSPIGGPAAIAAGAGIYSFEDSPYLAYSPESLITVPPGTIFGIMASGAGTSHIVQTTLWWREVAI